jgi:hypothetical protein
MTKGVVNGWPKGPEGKHVEEKMRKILMADSRSDHLKHLVWWVNERIKENITG